MKRIILICGLALLCFACSKKDEYKDLVGGKERNYAAIGDSISVLPGADRLKLTWMVVTDPNITKTVIYINSRKDSVVIPITREPGLQKFEHLFDPMPEGNYNFELVNYNSLGNRSVTQYITGRSYGEKYRATLLNRVLLDQEILTDESVQLEWGKSDVQSYGVDLEYTNSEDRLVKVRIATDLEKFNLSNYKKGSSYRYQTLFLPDTLCIDTFRTDWVERKPLFEKPMDKALFKAMSLPGDAPMVPGDNYRMENAWDGLWSTNFEDPYGPAGWRSLSSDLVSQTEPARATIDLGEEVQLSRYRINHYWKNENRMMKRYEIYGRADLPTDGTMDGWVKLYSFDRTDESAAAWVAGDNGIFDTTLPNVRYIRIVCYSNFQNTTDMGFAEITFWKYY